MKRSRTPFRSPFRIAAAIAASLVSSTYTRAAPWRPATIADDQQVDPRQLFDQLGSSTGGVGLSQVLGQIERRAVVRGVASLDGGYRQTERNVALPRTRRSQQQQSAVLRNEPHGAQIQDERLGDLRV